MVHPHSHQIPRVRCYSGYCYLRLYFVYRTLTFFGLSSHTVLLYFLLDSAVLTPQKLLPMVWPPPISLAATLGISFDFFSSAYLDVSVQRVPFLNLCIQLRIYDSSSQGFPHSEICGSMLISSLPQLIAGYHVLHRLSMPRHSPYALFCFNGRLLNSLSLSFV